MTAVGWAWSFQANVKQHVPKAEQQLEGLDEALTWHLSAQHALGSGYLAAWIWLSHSVYLLQQVSQEQ